MAVLLILEDLLILADRIGIKKGARISFMMYSRHPLMWMPIVRSGKRKISFSKCEKQHQNQSEGRRAVAAGNESPIVIRMTVIRNDRKLIEKIYLIILLV